MLKEKKKKISRGIKEIYFFIFVKKTSKKTAENNIRI